jgi:hypothetical protein
MPKGTYHRAGISSCPHCQHDFGFDDRNLWIKNATALVLEVVQGKHGSIAYISECPKCFKKSWVHNEIGCFYTHQEWPDGWEEAAEAEKGTRGLSNLRRFNHSLCASCTHIRGVEIGTAGWRYCALKGHGHFEEECDKFVKA